MEMLTIWTEGYIPAILTRYTHKRLINMIYPSSAINIEFRQTDQHQQKFKIQI
ncbi:hypothetical protein QJS04_geneDACA011163 [Acorus gramineus]|uniref:Uncharacterized protein n=1 Tax=Acorus gramineus TaxID=55184 RepID=A0AAV9BI13_ACOGR|nr:hypothetical protein QJS04_geneDACA011163 [Acorus gramineus]